MKTKDILEVNEYESVGGPIRSVPVTSVITFLNRILNRLVDIEDSTFSVSSFESEIRETIHLLED